MKQYKGKILSGIVLGLLVSMNSLVASANEIELNQAEIAVAAAEATVVRTSSTPEKVRIEMSIPFSHQVCERYGYVPTYGPDPSCGYDTRYERRNVCSTRRVCSVSHNGQCRTYREVRSCSTQTVPVRTMRSCTHMERQCVEYGTRTRQETRTVRLNFKKAGELTGAEIQKLHIKGKQNHYGGGNAVFEGEVIESREEIEIKSRQFFGDRLIVRKKKD